MSKIIEFGPEGREKLVKGINTLADAVVSTLGPNGRNVVIEKNHGQVPHLQRDRRRQELPGLQGKAEEDRHLRRRQARRQGPDVEGRQRGPDDARPSTSACFEVLRLVRDAEQPVADPGVL